MPDDAPDRLGALDRFDAVLALAVVAERGRLHDGRQADGAEGHGELVQRLHARERRHRKAAIGEERLLPRALLGDVQRRAARPHGRELRRRVGRGGRDVLELERHHVDAAREGADGVEVVVVGGNLEVGDLAGRRVVVGREACARGSPCGARRARTCGRADRRRARRSWRPAGRCGSREFRRAHLRVWSSRNARSLSRRSGRRGRENRDGEQARVPGAGLADGERAHRHAAGHLHDREQRIEPLQRGALHRHAEHRQRWCARPPCRAGARRRRRRR